MGRCVPSWAATNDESFKRTGAQKLIAACQMIPAISALALDLLYSQVMKIELAIVPNVYGIRKPIPRAAAIAPITPCKVKKLGRCQPPQVVPITRLAISGPYLFCN